MSKQEALKISHRDTPRLRYTREKLRSFAGRPRGWHYGEGQPAAPEAVDLALRLLDAAARRGLTRTNAFHGSDGSISLTFYHGPRYAELNFGAGEGIEYVEEDGGEETGYEEGLTPEEAEDKISDFRERAWASSGLLTSLTGMTSAASLTTGPLQVFARAASRSLITIALLGTAAESAPILRDSTATLRDSLPPTGTSPTTSCRTLADTNGGPAPPGMRATVTLRG